MRDPVYVDLAREQASRAFKLLEDVGSRRDEGPAFGAVKATAAQAHATLALFYQREASLQDED